MRASVHENATAPGAITIKAAQLKNGWARCVCVSALLLVIMLSGFVRMRLRNMPLEGDEGEGPNQVVKSKVGEVVTCTHKNIARFWWLLAGVRIQALGRGLRPTVCPYRESA